MELIVLVILAGIIIALITLSRIGANRTQNRRSSVQKPDSASTRTCPLCGSDLEPGERVRSVFYPSPGDTLAEIHGCPHCEGVDATAPRQCPVCKKTVPPGGHVIARVFKRPEKTHIHVLGCTGCRKGT